MDGQQQRKALTAAERAIAQLVNANPDGARRAAATAASLDQIGVFAGLEQAVAAAADELARGGTVSGESLGALRAAVGPGPLQAAVERLAVD